MQDSEFNDVKALLQQILDRDGVEGLLQSATLTILHYSHICGHGMMRGRRLFVVDSARQEDSDAE